MRTETQTIEREGRQPWVIEEVDLASTGDEIKSLIEAVGLSTEHVEMADVWLVCRENDRILGCMALERREPLVHIQSLSVSKEYRKKGIARALIDHGMENYMNPGEIMTALTLFWNIKTYEKLGFVRVEAAELKKADDVTGREKHRYCTALVRVKE